MRFHIPALPGQPVMKKNSTCAYTSKIHRFTLMMIARGHEVFIYGAPNIGGSQCDAKPTEYIGAYPKTPKPIEFTAEAWSPYNFAVAGEIVKRAQPGDFVCYAAGSSQEALDKILKASPDPIIGVEFGVGYGGTFAPFRVFESYAWMHTLYGSGIGSDAHKADGKWYDTMIPLYFDKRDFKVGVRGDYLLYLGRMIDRKGVAIAEKVAREMDLPIKYAGAPEDFKPKYGEVLGKVDPKKLAKLLAGAKALMVPTQYIEPFGGVVIEAHMSGTPTITTDWGAFTETVIPGFNGHRCRTIGEFKWAVQNVDHMSGKNIRDHAVKHYDLEAIAPKFETYFEQVTGLFDGNDWNSDWEGLSRFAKAGSSRYGVNS